MKSTKSYRNARFMNSRAARPLRILAEYVEPRSRLNAEKVEDSIVFFGSARLNEGHPHYEATRELARRLTEWSKGIDPEFMRRFVVCTGGGPGLMEAANRGAMEAGGRSIGLTIALPEEEGVNAYVTPELHFHFHYFFMRKFWFAYLAKALVVFPGGYGTLDELFEMLTLVQTKRMQKPMPIVMFGDGYWNEVVNFDEMIRQGMIDPEDARLVYRTESVDEAFAWLTGRLTTEALAKPGAML